MVNSWVYGFASVCVVLVGCGGSSSSGDDAGPGQTEVAAVLEPCLLDQCTADADAISLHVACQNARDDEVPVEPRRVGRSFNGGVLNPDSGARMQAGEVTLCAVPAGEGGPVAYTEQQCATFCSSAGGGQVSVVNNTVDESTQLPEHRCECQADVRALVNTVTINGACDAEGVSLVSFGVYKRAGGATDATALVRCQGGNDAGPSAIMAGCEALGSTLAEQSGLSLNSTSIDDFGTQCSVYLSAAQQ